MKEKTYEERKQELIDHFISHWIWVYTTEIKQNYPYSLDKADISKDKDGLRGSLNIPGYPITDEEFDEIINKINNYLKEFVRQLILNVENTRKENSSSSFYLDGFEEQESQNNKNR